MKTRIPIDHWGLPTEPPYYYDEIDVEEEVTRCCACCNEIRYKDEEIELKGHIFCKDCSDLQGEEILCCGKCGEELLWIDQFSFNRMTFCGKCYKEVIHPENNFFEVQKYKGVSVLSKLVNYSLINI